MFKVLYGPFVLFRRFHGVESPEVSALFCFGVYFPGVDAVLT